MPTFRVEQYELHKVSYLVEDVVSPADAIEQVVKGLVNMEDDTGEFLELAEAYAAPLADEVTAELRERGLQVFEQRVPSIRSVQEVP